MKKQQIVEILWKHMFVENMSGDVLVAVTNKMDEIADEILQLAAAQWQPGVLEEEKDAYLYFKDKGIQERYYNCAQCQVDGQDSCVLHSTLSQSVGDEPV